MAKKNSVPLTPEELAAKKERKSEKRKIFGETFLKAIAVMLAIVFVYSVVYVAFGQGMTVMQKVNSTGTVAGSGSASAGTGTVSGGSSAGAVTDTGSASTDTGTASTPSGTGSASSGSSAGGSAPAATDAATVAATINKATAAAAGGKAGYNWVRTCKWTTPVDVGGSTVTAILNRIIQGVSEGDDLNSVVGGFLGVGEKKGTIAKGGKFEYPNPEHPKEMSSYHADDFALKATQLKPEDLQGLQVNGNTYTFTIPDVTSPQKDNSTAFSRLTNDIVVLSQVNQEIQEQVGSAVVVNELEANYKNIKVTVTVDGDKLTSLAFSHDADATLKLKAGISITGTGAIQTSVKYSDFKY